jgi:hypothetical protein
LSEKLAKCRAVAKLGAKHDHIDEVADQSGELRPASSRDWRADQHIILTCQAMQ